MNTELLYGAVYGSALDRSLKFRKFLDKMSSIFLSKYFDNGFLSLNKFVEKPCLMASC